MYAFWDPFPLSQSPYNEIKKEGTPSSESKGSNVEITTADENSSDEDYEVLHALYVLEYLKWASGVDRKVFAYLNNISSSRVSVFSVFLLSHAYISNAQVKKLLYVREQLEKVDQVTRMRTVRNEELKGNLQVGERQKEKRVVQ